jgi:hypothetical protein
MVGIESSAEICFARFRGIASSKREKAPASSTT